MAEFQEVVRQIKRMCDSHGASCHGCPLKEKGGLCTLVHGDDFIPEDWEMIKAAEIELVVRHWAAAHPESRYPTWDEWWKREFPAADNAIYPCTFGIRERFACSGQGCETCRAQPIPADIAEKLGIKLIGGEEDA